VTDGPLPPHERAWRHPSEITPPPPEPTSRSGLILIMSTAAFGLLLVGALAVTMTPGQSRNTETALDAIAVASTELSVAVGGAVPSLADRSRGGDPAAAPPTAGALDGTEPEVPAASPVGADTGLHRAVATSAAPATLTGSTELPPVPSAPGDTLGNGTAAAPIITPIAEGLGVTTAAALDAPRSTAGHLSGVLPSGAAVEVDVLIKSGELLLVTFATPWDDATPLMPSAAPAERGDELFVLVDGAAVPVGSAQLDRLPAREGAPVVDTNGSLVAIYSGDGDATGLVYVPQTPLLPGDTLVSEPQPGDPSTLDSTATDTAAPSPPSTDGATTGDTSAAATPPTTAAHAGTTTTAGGTDPVPTEPDGEATDPTEPTADAHPVAASEPPASSEPPADSEPPAGSGPPAQAPPATGADAASTTG